MKVVAVVQARMGSTRLPNKVMKPIGGIPMIEILLSRLSKSHEVNQIVLATSVDKRNKPLVDHVRKLGYFSVEGSENDVLARYVQAAQEHNADIVVRITGDCPIVDPDLVDECIRQFKVSDVDYLTNTNPPTYPDGLDIEVFTFKALQQAQKEASKSYDREHVTPYLRESGLFTLGSVRHYKVLPAIHNWSQDMERINGGQKVAPDFTYCSDNNSEWMSIQALQKWIDENSNKIGKI